MRFLTLRLPHFCVQLAADAEAAKAKQGRGVLGELERGALGKGKVQAASVRKLRSSMSGAKVQHDGHWVCGLGAEWLAQQVWRLLVPAVAVLPLGQPRCCSIARNDDVSKSWFAAVDIASVAGEDVSYSEERGRRLLYRDEGLHLEVLQVCNFCCRAVLQH